jgi:hypothetical protein
LATYRQLIGPSFRTPLFPVFQKMLLARDAQRAYFSKLRHRPNFGQERICFHLRIGAVVLFDRSAQLAEGKFWNLLLNWATRVTFFNDQCVEHA